MSGFEELGRCHSSTGADTERTATSRSERVSRQRSANLNATVRRNWTLYRQRKNLQHTRDIQRRWSTGSSQDFKESDIEEPRDYDPLSARPLFLEAEERLSLEDEENTLDPINFKPDYLVNRINCLIEDVEKQALSHEEFFLNVKELMLQAEQPYSSGSYISLLSECHDYEEIGEKDYKCLSDRNRKKRDYQQQFSETRRLSAPVHALLAQPSLERSTSLPVLIESPPKDRGECHLDLTKKVFKKRSLKVCSKVTAYSIDSEGYCLVKRRHSLSQSDLSPMTPVSMATIPIQAPQLPPRNQPLKREADFREDSCPVDVPYLGQSSCSTEDSFLRIGSLPMKYSYSAKNGFSTLKGRPLPTLPAEEQLGGKAPKKGTPPPLPPRPIHTFFNQPRSSTKNPSKVSKDKQLPQSLQKKILSPPKSPPYRSSTFSSSDFDEDFEEMLYNSSSYTQIGVEKDGSNSVSSPQPARSDEESFLHQSKAPLEGISPRSLSTLSSEQDYLEDVGLLVLAMASKKSKSSATLLSATMPTKSSSYFNLDQIDDETVLGFNQQLSTQCRTRSLDTILDSSGRHEYCIPPDAVLGYVEAIYCDPMNFFFKILKMVNRCHSKYKKIHKEGFLNVLTPGRRKMTVQSRYFVLEQEQLRMYNNKASSNKPGSCRRLFYLDSWCTKRALGDRMFELSTLEGRLHLQAKSEEEYQSWLDTLSQIMKRAQVLDCLLPNQEDPVLTKGSILAVINGVTYKVFADITNRSLSFFANEETEKPFLVLDLDLVTVTSKLRDENFPKPLHDKCVAFLIHLEDSQHSVYILLRNKAEFNSWHYYLCLGSNTTSVFSPLENFIMKMQIDQAIATNMEVILERSSIPLTYLPNHQLVEQAKEMFKGLKLYMSTPLSQISEKEVDYFVGFIQTQLHHCMKVKELQDELYCQLIKLSTETHHDNLAVLQVWEIIAIAIPLFLPLKTKILWYLEQHIQQYLSCNVSTIENFAELCLNRLERAKLNNRRVYKPLSHEIRYQLAQFPHPPVKPFSIEVSLSTSEILKIDIDPSTTVQEVVSQINQEIGLPASSETGFSLACDWPGLSDSNCTEISLHPKEKLLDVGSHWRDSLANISGQARPECRQPCFFYYNRIYYKRRALLEDSKEALLLAEQWRQDIVNGRVKVEDNIATELTALMLQIHHGNHGNHSRESLNRVVEAEIRISYPMAEWRSSFETQKMQLKQNIIEKWKLLQDKEKDSSIRIYINRLRQVPMFGFRKFEAYCYTVSGLVPVTIALNEECVQIVGIDKQEQQYGYQLIESFGSCGGDFMLYINDNALRVSTKLLFSFPHNVLVKELTLLMATFIETFWDTHPWVAEQQFRTSK